MAAARGGGAVQPRRAGRARGGAALPGEPVHRPRDPAGAGLRAPLARPLHRRPAHQGGHGELRHPRRPLAAARTDGGAGPGAGSGAERRRARGAARSTAASSPCATGTPSARKRRARCSDWGAGRRSLLLPLYPQFSTTTTGSSIAAWNAGGARRSASPCRPRRSAAGIPTPASPRPPPRWCARPGTRPGPGCPPATGLRILFSAHGLPESIVKHGDPYQWQVERTVAAVVERLGIDGLDHQVCYQSRVTPQRWIGPSTEEALERGGARTRWRRWSAPSPSCPSIRRRWWSSTSSTAKLAHKLGVPGYFRVPAQNSDAGFIAALARRWCGGRGTAGATLCSFAGARQCPRVHRRLPARQGRGGAERRGARGGAGQGPGAGVTAGDARMRGGRRGRAVRLRRRAGRQRGAGEPARRGGPDRARLAHARPSSAAETFLGMALPDMLPVIEARVGPPAGGLGRGAVAPHRRCPVAGAGAGAGRGGGRAGGGGGRLARRRRLQLGAGGAGGQAASGSAWRRSSPAASSPSRTWRGRSPRPTSTWPPRAACGAGAGDCVVVEDSLLGVRAGIAAGCRVLGLGAARPTPRCWPGGRRRALRRPWRRCRPCSAWRKPAHDASPRWRRSIPGPRRCTCSRSSPGWPGCSTCRGSTSTTRPRRPARRAARPSRRWSGGCSAPS